MNRTTLGEQAVIVMGQSPPGDSYNRGGRGLPLLNGPTEFGSEHPIATQWTDRPTKICAPGDILFCVRGATAGRVNVADKEYCIGRGLAAIRGRRSVDTRFLLHALTRGYADFQSRGVGSTFINLSQTDLAEFELPMLETGEQRRIAKILDKADALLAKRRAALFQLDTLRRSIFLEMFGDPATNPKRWPVRRIGDLLESASYGTSAKAGAVGEFPVLRMNNITRSGEMDFTDLKYIDLEKDNRDRWLVRPGDVLFNRTNSTDLVGKTALFRKATPMVYAGYLIRMRVNKDNEPEYVATFLNTDYAKRVLRAMCKSIIGMANINATELQSIAVQEPAVSVQREFASRVGAVEGFKMTQRESLAELDALFASLQHRAFRGEL